MSGRGLISHAAFHPVPRQAASDYPAGAEPPAWRPGDFLLTRSDTLFGRLIRFGQALRVHGADRRYTYWNHAALVVGEAGELIEALGTGVTRTNASKYLGTEYTVVRIIASDADRAEAVAFACWAADQHACYGWLDIASLALTLVTGAKLSFFIDGQFICSALVAQALERTTAIFNRSPVHVTPADLAKYYQVAIPAHSGTAAGTPAPQGQRPAGPAAEDSRGNP